MDTGKRLYRSRKNRLLGGVCGGIAEYFKVDPVLVRLIAIIIGLVSGPLAVVAYIVAWLIMPEPTGGGDEGGGRSVVDTKYEVDPQEDAGTQEKSDATGGSNESGEPAGEPGGSGSSTGSMPGNESLSSSEKSHSLIGYVLVAIGGVLLLGRLGPLFGFSWSLRTLFRMFWPIALILLGIVLLVTSKRSVGD